MNHHNQLIKEVKKRKHIMKISWLNEKNSKQIYFLSKFMFSKLFPNCYPLAFQLFAHICHNK